MSSLVVVVAWLGVVWLHRKFAPPSVLHVYANSRPWAAYMASCCLLALVVAGLLDSRFDWARLPLVVGLYCLGSAINLQALRDNPFFHPEIIRPPFKVSSGIYRYFDHPGYFGFLLRFLGLACFINTPLATTIFLIYASFLAIRSVRENEVLRGL